MSAKLHIDIETFSECDLKKAGAYVYAEDESTEVLCYAFAFDEDPPLLWRPGMKHDPHLVNYITKGGHIHAFNANFERTILNGKPGRKIGFPSIQIGQTRCVAAKTATHNLPRDLGSAAKALGTTPKDETGRNTMLQLAKPRKGKEKRYTRENAPEKFEILERYCIGDVLAERDLDNHIPDLTEYEQGVYEFDQRINDRGWKIDLESIDNAKFLVDLYKDQMHKQCVDLTGFTPTQRDKIAAWVREKNPALPLPDLQAETIKWALKRKEITCDVATVLKIYSTYNAKAITKLDSMRAAVCADGRLRGMFLYHAAGTGRWSSLKVQLHNMFRGALGEDDDAATAIEAMRQRDLDFLRMLYPSIDPLKVIASCMRGMLVAA